MHIRCSYCRHSFNLSRDYLVQAVEESTAKGQKYHSVECIKCRKQIKVPLSQMRRFVPKTQPESDDVDA